MAHNILLIDSVQPTYNIEAASTNDSGLESLQTRVENKTLMQGATSSNLLPPRIS